MEQPTRNRRRKPPARLPDPVEIEAALRGEVPPKSADPALMSYWLGVLHDPNASPARRDKAAVDLAKYLHRRR